jgi:hypothetical protein
MGCRDLATLEVVCRHGVEAEFGGCVIQTLPAARPATRQGCNEVNCAAPDAT